MANANLIKSARIAAGMTQTQMAKAIGCSPNTYCEKENGHYSFTVEEAIAFCRAAGVTEPKDKAKIFLT